MADPTVKLTEPRERALRNVAEGLVYYVAKTKKWHHRKHWQALRPEPYRALRKAGLIDLDPMANPYQEHRVVLAPQGHALLAALATHQATEGADNP